MGRGGQTPVRIVDGRCPSLFFFTHRHRTPTPHQQQRRSERHSGGGADAASYIVRYCTVVFATP